MAKIAECVSFSGMMNSYCNLGSPLWNQKVCHDSLTSAESCVKKIYKKKYKGKYRNERVGTW